MVNVLIGLGANLGNPAENLNVAKIHLANMKSTELISVSDWLSTVPIGGPSNQNAFVNGAALLRTSLCPEDLADELQSIESNLGRQRIVRWGPRLIDLDIVLYGEQVVETAKLQIPHPWMAVRRFVLEPAAKIASHLVHPRIGATVGELFANLNRQPTRIEITGLACVDTTAVANWLASEVHGQLAYPDGMDRHASWALADGPSAKEAIELLNSWDGSSSGSSNLPADASIIVSDRWCEEILVVGQLYLSASDFAQLNEAWQARPLDDCGRLLVVLEDSSAESIDDRLSVEFWNRVRSPGHGPWLVLDASKPDKMQHELLAAVNGMK